MGVYRAELLLANGYPADYSDVKYECTKCGDTGFVDNKMCSCMKEALTLAGIESSGFANLIKEQRFDNFSLDYYKKNATHYDMMGKNLEFLKEYAKNGMIIINFTNDIEDALFGNKVIVIYDKKVICEGKTMSVLNEEKILKRLNIGLPFIVELSKYFMDYGMIDKYYLTNEKLIGALWK